MTTSASTSPKGNLLNLAGIRGPAYADVSLAPLTTWKIGGAAARLAAPARVEDVYRLMRLAQEQGLPLIEVYRLVPRE